MGLGSKLKKAVKKTVKAVVSKKGLAVIAPETALVTAAASPAERKALVNTYGKYAAPVGGVVAGPLGADLGQAAANVASANVNPASRPILQRNQDGSVSVAGVSLTTIGIYAGVALVGLLIYRRYA